MLTPRHRSATSLDDRVKPDPDDRNCFFPAVSLAASSLSYTAAGTVVLMTGFEPASTCGYRGAQITHNGLAPTMSTSCCSTPRSTAPGWTRWATGLTARPDVADVAESASSVRRGVHADYGMTELSGQAADARARAPPRAINGEPDSLGAVGRMDAWRRYGWWPTHEDVAVGVSAGSWCA